MIVLDASVLADFLLGRPQAMAALGAELAGHEQEPLHAPELIEPETLNALRRLAAKGSVSEERASEAVSDLADVRLVRYPQAPLRARVWELRHNLTAYDASYLALSEALEDSILLTGDGGLAEQARVHLGDDRVRHVE
ncbi:MAG TPA: type II toxin-antitoxin system VapC family toxin [Solirubrobacteraceae bacterium]|nr:type II toxin-antitoxin system VapC family toxin [Solirubrobacteraceae bacterium]